MASPSTLNPQVSQTLQTEFSRAVFETDTVIVRPILPHPPGFVVPPVFSARLHKLNSSSIELMRGSSVDAPAIAKATYEAEGKKIKIELGFDVCKLEQIYTFNPPGSFYKTEVVEPERSTWTRRLKEGYGHAWVGRVSPATRLRWEPADKKGDLGDIVMQCVLTSVNGVGLEILGEAFRKNEYIRLAPNLDIQSSVGVCVILGFMTFYERAKAIKENAEVLDFVMDMAGGGGGA